MVLVIFQGNVVGKKKGDQSMPEMDGRMPRLRPWLSDPVGLENWIEGRRVAAPPAGLEGVTALIDHARFVEKLGPVFMGPFPSVKGMILRKPLEFQSVAFSSKAQSARIRCGLSHGTFHRWWQGGGARGRRPVPVRRGSP